jgi:cytochrome c peroxidase
MVIINCSSTGADKLSSMVWPYTFFLIRKAAGLAIVLAVLIGAGGSIFAAGELGLQALRKQYYRPAQIPYPKDDPYSKAKFELGRILFFDPLLSGSKVRSCATCHNPGLSWGDGEQHAVGEKQLLLRAPTLLNVAWTPKLGWDGHFRDLESVAIGPLSSADNMNLPVHELIARLSAIPGYVAAFNGAYGKGDITQQKIEQALATFERSIVSTDAPFDRFIAGDQRAIDEPAKRGFVLFNGKANCAACHSGWAFTDSSFHDVGVAAGDDTGRGRLFPTSVKLKYAFKTPTLRDVIRRGPYMHDGSVAALNDVIALYDRGGIDRPSRDSEIHPLNLSGGEKADLVVFLQTLSSAPKSFAVPVLPR